MKIRPVLAELFHADGQTYVTKLIVAFRNYSELNGGGGGGTNANKYRHSPTVSSSLFREVPVPVGIAST